MRAGDAAKAGEAPRHLSRKTSRAVLLPILRHSLPPSTDVTVHWIHVAQIGTCTLREPPHQKKTSLSLRIAEQSRGKALETKPASAFFVRPRPRQQGRLRQHHRLRHAWLASHRRAPSSQQSKSPINSVAVDIRDQVAISLQVAVAVRLVVSQKRRARAEQSAIRHQASGLGPVLEIEVCVGFFGAAC